MKSIRTLLEGEIEKAQSALAARDMVDQLQDMVEKLNKLKVEELVALKETLRNSQGNEVADQFVQATDAALASAVEAVTQARDSVDQAALGVSGEAEMPAAGEGEAAADVAADVAADLGGEGGEEPSPEAPVTDVAAGGEEPLGRGKRESRERDLKRMVESLERKIRMQKQQFAEARMKQLKEKAPPGMEQWIKDRKAGFKKQYGDDWEGKLYATAWKEEAKQIDEANYTVNIRGNDFSYNSLRDALDDGHPDHAKIHKNGKLLGTIGSVRVDRSKPAKSKSVKEFADATVKERNAFTAALANTPKGGKFTVGGKTYTDKSNVEETVDDGVGDMKVQQLLKKTGNNKIKLLKWLERNAGISNELDLNFDDVDLVYKGRTILPMALHDPKFRMKDLLDAVLAAKKPKGTPSTKREYNPEITEMARNSKKMKNKPSKKMK